MRTSARNTALGVIAALTVATLPATSFAASDDLVLDRVAGDDRVATAVAISREGFNSADTALLARADDFADALAATPVAAALGAPLLLTDRDAVPAEVDAELARLGVDTVVLLGGEAAIGPGVAAGLGDREVRRIHGVNRYATATELGRELDGPTGAVVASGEDFTDALSAAPLAAHLGWPLVLSLPDRLDTSTREFLDELDPAEVLLIGGPSVIDGDVEADLATLADDVTRLAGTDRYTTGLAVHDEAVARGMGTDTIWLATARAFPDALAAGATVVATGGSLVLVDGQDLREPLEVAHHLAALADAPEPLRRLVMVGGPGAITRDALWQVSVVLDGAELPRGGLTLFPRNRIVAFYGNHTAASMGVLGEQPPDQAYARLWDQAEPYEVLGDRQVLPTFELIVTVATAGPGDDGDYSKWSSPDQIQPWLDAARRHGVYLLLDIQPGRSDFLTEVRRYESFLTEPDVGIALDPEWRMDADEVPGRSVGEVDAAEVNAVADYLAEIVRTHALPQKLLVVHQFQTRMVERKDLIENPAELAVLFHMDGHGSQGGKRNTYAAVSDVTGRWWNGFKLFYDEDTDMMEPAELLGTVRPIPDLISYQ